MMDENFRTIEDRLKSLKIIKPEVPFRDGLRLRLVEKAQGVSKPAVTGNFGRRFALVISLMVVFLAGGSVVLAGNSLPGHPLYPVKRGMENVRLIFVSHDEKPKVEQKLADDRIQELEEVAFDKNEEASNYAIGEVENSLNQISLQVMAARNKYKSVISGSEVTEAELEEAKKLLEELLDILNEKENKLTGIETSLSEESQSKLNLIRENLQTLKAEVEKILVESEDKETPVQGVETEKESIKNTNPRQ